MMCDILIKNGLIVDGLGGESFAGCVGVTGEDIAWVGKDEIPAHEVYDAGGAVICPGFIDIHSHADMGILLLPGAENYTRQGVSTVVTGNCGLSLAPSNCLHEAELQSYIVSFVSGEIRKIWDWNSFGEFLDRVDSKFPAVNIVPLAGHGTIRIACEGFKEEPARGQRLSAMGMLLEECLAQGAWGMSTGLIYPPGSYSDTQELEYFFEILGRHKALYATHLRSEGRYLIESVEEAISLAEKHSTPLQLSHHKAAPNGAWGKTADTLAMINGARARGVDVRCDVYPFDRSSTAITALLPGYMLEGGVDTLLQRLQNPSDKHDMIRRIIDGHDEEITLRDMDWRDITIIYCPAAPKYETRTIDEIVPCGNDSERIERFLDWLFEIRATGLMVLRSMSMEDVDRVIMDRESIIASDSWISDRSTPEKCHPRNFGTFTQFIKSYVCEKRMLSIEDAVRKITSEPAGRIGLSDRGVIAKGQKADILVFEPNELDNLPTFEEPKRFPSGIHRLWINGKLHPAYGSPQRGSGHVLRRKSDKSSK